MAKATSKSVQKDELIDSRVSATQCKKAVDALTNHAAKVAKERDENELLGGKEENVWLVLTVKRSHPEKKVKPQRIPLRYPVVDPRTTAICLITKDPQREYKDLLEQHNIKFISRVVGIEKLKGKFKPFEARRMLLKENGMFLADERVVPLLPGLLGKKFFEAKKQPIPVNLTKKELKTELELAVSSAYMHLNQGTCTSIKIGTLSHSPAQILENIKTALPAVIKKVRGGWDNVQSFNIKTNSSISLPIWTCALGDGADGRWGGGEDEKAGGEDEKASGDEEAEPWGGIGSGDEMVVDADAGKKSKRRKKRRAEGDETSLKKKAKKSTKLEPAAASLSAPSTPTHAVPPVPTNTPAAAAPESAPVASPSTVKKKRAKKSKLAATETPSKELSSAPAPTPASKESTGTVTPSGVKEKRSSEGITKKKARITKGGAAGKSGKAKEELVGKKVKAKI